MKLGKWRKSKEQVDSNCRTKSHLLSPDESGKFEKKKWGFSNSWFWKICDLAIDLIDRCKGKRKGICLLEVLNEGSVTLSVFWGKVFSSFQIANAIPRVFCISNYYFCISNYFLTKIKLLSLILNSEKDGKYKCFNGSFSSWCWCLIVGIRQPSYLFLWYNIQSWVFLK